MKSFDVVAETRRRRTAEERRRIVTESETAPVSVVARRHGIAVSLVFRWSDEMRPRSGRCRVGCAKLK